jgi:hypothetical protein
MTIAGSILSCCCDGGGSCADVDIASLPSTANIDASWTFTWLTNFYRVDQTWIVDVVPRPPGGCPNNYQACGPELDQCSQPCTVWSHQLFAQHTATLTVNASGVIPLAVSGTGSSFVRFYRGQIGFSYTFASDYPGACSVSGTFSPSSNDYPTGQAEGMLVDIHCDSRNGTWATGMCNPYSTGVSPNQYPEMLIATGPHLRLGFEIPYADLEDTAPDEAPDCVDPSSDYEWKPRGVGYIGGLGVPLPWLKVRPLKVLFVRSDDAVGGGYQMARGVYAGSGVAPNGTESYPRTRHEAACQPVGDCSITAFLGTACDKDVDRGPSSGGNSLFCYDCGTFGYQSDSGLVTVDCSHRDVASTSCCVYGSSDHAWGSTVNPSVGTPDNCYQDSTPGYFGAASVLGELTSQSATVGFS